MRGKKFCMLKFSSTVFQGAWENVSSLIALPGMQQTHGDLNINIIWTNSPYLQYPVDDPIYSAHKKRVYTAEFSGLNRTTYTADLPAGVAGCIEQVCLRLQSDIQATETCRKTDFSQYQFCIENGRLCSSPSGVALGGLGDKFPTATNKQKATLQSLSQGTMAFGISNPLDAHPPYLASIDGLLPPSWKADYLKMEGFVWAGYQLLLGWQAAGPPNGTASAFYSPTDEGQRELCRSQKVVKAGGFANSMCRSVNCS